MKLLRFFQFVLILFMLISTLISATLISAPNSRYIPQGIGYLYQGGDPPVPYA